MKPGDQYLKWIEWSETDQVYIGQCPNLITGIHGDDPVVLYGELCEVIADVINALQAAGRELPPVTIRPMVANAG
ncbi:pilus assembly protein HicB [Thiospirillum jenense]|uniref:Pilus assembly protein HicB n=1 Tax=Thiospirillum jenense TaxID=1653858 RepID=A0A839HDP8_9GAMM|nr:pilus assembly protein HicB [Thiospirillum jenense]MBB1127055.1 pilus assembly protein HicB [Thiospirillum jenense]